MAERGSPEPRASASGRPVVRGTYNADGTEGSPLGTVTVASALWPGWSFALAEQAGRGRRHVAKNGDTAR